VKLQRAYYPACIIVLLVVLAFGLCNICQLYLLKDTYPVSKLWVGSDYACIYSATLNLARGGSPYENEWTFPPIADQFIHDIFINKKTPWYNYSPVPAYLNYPLLYFDIDTASRMLFFLLIASVLGAYVIINHSFEYSEGKDRKIIFLCGLIIIVLSYPFYFLIVRGHMTGIVIMLLAMGIYFFKKNNSVCSIFFGLSIGMIIYPVLLLVPLLLFRRYKIIAYTLFTIIILVLCCPILWFEFLNKLLIPRIIGGGSFCTIQENCSLTNVFFFLSLSINKILATAGFPRLPVIHDMLSHITNAIMIFAMAIADIQIQKKYSPLDKELETAFIMMYLPFMISIPTDSYQYGLVLIILLVPVLSILTQKLVKPMPEIILWIFITGIFLSQIQAHSFQQLLNPQNSFFHFFPAFGLFLVMIGCVTFKIWFWWRALNRPGTLRILPE
jgi:hypothetical protein